jgi:hypothetical protein
MASKLVKDKMRSILSSNSNRLHERRTTFIALNHCLGHICAIVQRLPFVVVSKALRREFFTDLLLVGAIGLAGVFEAAARFVLPLGALEAVSVGAGAEAPTSRDLSDTMSL